MWVNVENRQIDTCNLMGKESITISDTKKKLGSLTRRIKYEVFRFGKNKFLQMGLIFIPNFGGKKRHCVWKFFPVRILRVSIVWG